MRCLAALLIVVGLTACGDEPLRFTNVRVEEVGAYRAVVRFETSREATCRLSFGTAPDALDKSATDPNMEPGTFLVQHQVPLEDLAPQTGLYFVAVATDPDGVEYRSDPGQFSTGAGVPVDSLTNVALLQAGTSITAVSSNYALGSNASTWGVNNAIDGLMASEWSSNMDGNNAFFALDLGQTRDVTVIGFRSRKMTDGTSIIRKIAVTVNDQLSLGPFDTPDPDVRYVLELAQPVTMRTVRVSAVETTGGNTGVKELQLFVP